MQQGFTLIEILVAIIIFTAVITTVVSLLGSALKSQGQVMAQSEVLNSASYTSEYISRALRMAKKDIAGNCIGLKNNFTQPGGSSSIRFLNYNNKCQEFLLSGGAVMVRKSTDDSAAKLSASEAITTAAILVANLRFDISGNNQTDGLQPKVSFTFQMQSRKIDIKPIQIQTVVSQRDLDIPR